MDGSIITAAGLTSWIDVALRVVHRLASAELAMKLSGYFLLDAAYREQRYYQVFAPPSPHKDALVAEVQAWLERNCTTNFDTRALAHEIGASPRTIQRRFVAVMGTTIGAYLQQLRMQRACSLLATTEQSVESIVWEVGYRDVSGFRRLFKERVGLTPSEYRNRFWLATPAQAAQ
ncbi:MAG: helix-turn-helix domain-containing protein [Polyangiaceae bacterium]